MLNFEDEMKAVRKGYVVLDIDEYNRLRDEIAAANMKAYEAEQLANRRIAEVAANNEALVGKIFRIVKNKYGDKDIAIEFNVRTIRRLAAEMMIKTFSAEELHGYELKSADDMLILDEILAVHTGAAEDINNDE